MATASPALQAARLTLAAAIISAICFPALWQPAVSGLYSKLYNWPLFNRSFFETVETLFCYSFIEPIYTAVFARSPNSRVDVRQFRQRKQQDNGKSNISPSLPKMKRPHKRMVELLTFASPLLLLDCTMVKKYADVDVAAIRQSAGYSNCSSHADGCSAAAQMSGYFLSPSLHNFSPQSPLQLHRALPAEAPSSRRLALELITSIFLYDLFFFSIHLAFHKIPALARVHLAHHKHEEMHPQVTNRLSIGERLSLILLANFALNIIGSHVLTRTLFVPLFLYLLIEVHSGVDLPWQYDKVLPAGWGAGARKHASHHRDGKKYFAPFFCWWDDAWERIENATSAKVGDS